MTPTDVTSDAPTARWQNAKIVDIVQRTPRIKSYFMALPEPFDVSRRPTRRRAADGT